MLFRSRRGVAKYRGCALGFLCEQLRRHDACPRLTRPEQAAAYGVKQAAPRVDDGIRRDVLKACLGGKSDQPGSVIGYWGVVNFLHKINSLRGFSGKRPQACMHFVIESNEALRQILAPQPLTAVAGHAHSAGARGRPVGFNHMAKR